jgi:hypothetical protein
VTARNFGRRLYEGWMVIAGRFGEIQTLLIVSAVYVFVVGPIAVGALLARQDLLAKRSPADGESVWLPADSTTSPDLERARRLF